MWRDSKQEVLTPAGMIHIQEHSLRGLLGIAICCKQLKRYPEAKTAIEAGLAIAMKKETPPSVLPTLACLWGERGYVSLCKYQGCCKLHELMRHAHATSWMQCCSIMILLTAIL